MDIAELFIAHLLWGNPNMLHITPDGKKVYFLVGNTLVCIPAPEGKTYKDVPEEDLNNVIQDYVCQLTDA